MEGLAAAGGIAPETVLERGSDPDSGSGGVGTRLGRSPHEPGRPRCRDEGPENWLAGLARPAATRRSPPCPGSGWSGTGSTGLDAAVTTVVVKTAPDQPPAAATGSKTGARTWKTRQASEIGGKTAGGSDAAFGFSVGAGELRGASAAVAVADFFFSLSPLAFLSAERAAPRPVPRARPPALTAALAVSPVTGVGLCRCRCRCRYRIGSALNGCAGGFLDLRSRSGNRCQRGTTRFNGRAQGWRRSGSGDRGGHGWRPRRRGG